ncbi:RCC1 and BTB domain-containing protein 1-like isoform X2 [Pseudomyrmex gracilis]|uniref:RCC1 and BTB domain-containing protein 1-like isoform X2 n=1 Tax=Pseudomyrmex gracilis TaxID=219809 RepID=UPI0009955DE4|nr:RCC1 and BTB domain-containing protein 1-like isoform X2 [Pseudomyrmex gracilis]
MSSNISSEGTSTIERVEYLGDKMQVQNLESKSVNILNKVCPVFNLLSKEFISKLYMIQICGKTSDGALLMTTDLMTYGLGNNQGGQLGIGHMSTTQPVLIGILSGQKIKKLIYLNSPAVFVLTEKGQIYSWGSNQYNLGLEDQQAYGTTRLPSLITSLKKERIIDIAASVYHAVALTESGKIYLWGVLVYYIYNNHQAIVSSSKNVKVPQLVWNDMSEQIKYICCGYNFTIAVTNKGVYGVGDNSNYQLGINDNSLLISKDTSVRFKLIFCNEKLEAIHNDVVKVVCGLHHVMALDNEGNLYVWGSNTRGQLGINKSTDKSICKMLDVPEMGKIVNIAALSHKDISVALNDKGRVYVWGFYFHLVDYPMEINVSDMYTVFGCELPYIIRTSTLKYSKTSENIETMFDDSSVSDLTIRVQGQPIHVHKVILNIRSEYFRNMFHQTEWKNSHQSVIEHNEFSYDIYKCFLKYLYTGKIDLPVEKTLELLALANKYKETELMNCCIQILKNECTKENSDKFVTMILSTIQKL